MTQNFITPQLDYIFFVYGLAFLVLGAICWILARTNRDRLPFSWLALFGVLHGVYQLLEMLTLSLADPFLFKVVRLMLLAGSFAALFEFGRRSWLTQTKSNDLGTWMYYPLVFLAAIGGLEGIKGINATCQYTLGFTSALLAAVALWREANSTASKETRQLKIAAVAMFIYSLSAGLLPAKSAFAPASWLNQEAFLETLGFPIQLVRAGCALVVASGIWRFFLARWVDSLDFPLEKDWTLGGRWLTLSLTIAILAGLAFTQFIGNRADVNDRKNLLVQASMVAGGVSKEGIKRLSGSVLDLESPDYDLIHKQLEMMRKGNPGCRFLYLLGWKDTLVIFLSDSEPRNSKDFSPPGSVYDDVPASVRKLFETGKEITEGPYNDKWGSWISAFVPLRESQPDGKVIAVLGMDISSAAWSRNISLSRLAPIFVTLVVVALIIGFFAMQLRSKESELKIRASERRLRIIFNSAHDALILEDATGRVISFNDMMLELFQITENQVLSTTVETDLPGPASPIDTMPEIWRRVLDGEDQVLEWEAKRADDTCFQAEVILKKLHDGKQDFVLTSIRDITERKKSQEALSKAKTELEKTNEKLRESIKEAEKLAVEAQSANIAKSQFLANVSHEIRTPLNGVIGMTELLLDTELDQKQREYADVVKIGGDNLLTLINDVLDFSKIEAGKLELETIDFDLRATIEDISDLLAVRAQEKDLEFVCLIDPEVPAFVRGDPGRLRQVMNNIAGNAVKFTPSGEVSVHVALLGELDDKSILKFTVSDTGIGIPENKADLLFNPFTQIDDSNTRQFGGTGLGLSISKNLVEKMGGEIGVQSDEHDGSTFWFTVVFEQLASAPLEATAATEEICGRRVLGVDDNATNRRLLDAYLQSWGCRFDLVEGGAQAIAKLREAAMSGDPFEIAVLDMQMPGMDGETLGEIIKTDPALKDVILIMMTSLSRRGDAKRLEEKGFSGYLTKPVRQSQLHDCLVMSLGQACDQTSWKNKRIVTRHTIAEAKRRRLRILVAEDNDTNQKLAVAVLEKMGHQVRAVYNGKDAVEVLKEEKFDVVLMDVQMPVMDGFEATRIIRANNADILCRDVFIVAMTAHAIKGDREKCLRSGMDDYISKPIQARELAEILERWANGNENCETNDDWKNEPTNLTYHENAVTEMRCAPTDNDLN